MNKFLSVVFLTILCSCSEPLINNVTTSPAINLSNPTNKESLSTNFAIVGTASKMSLTGNLNLYVLSSKTNIKANIKIIKTTIQSVNVPLVLTEGTYEYWIIYTDDSVSITSPKRVFYVSNNNSQTSSSSQSSFVESSSSQSSTYQTSQSSAVYSSEVTSSAYSSQISSYSSKSSIASSSAYSSEKIQPNYIIHYYTDWTSANIHFSTNSVWTAVPGVTMTKGSGKWWLFTCPTNTSSIVFCFNNGTLWDSKNQANYIIYSTNSEVWVSNQNLVFIQDSIPPLVSISSPVEGKNVSGSENIQIEVSDNVGISKVEFYDGTNKFYTATSSPWTGIWNSAYSKNGLHSITAIAYDTCGNKTQSWPVSVTTANENVAPIINIETNIHGTFGIMVNLDATGCYDPNGSIVSYVWNINNTTIRGASTNIIINNVGSYEGILTLADDEGATISKAFRITISSNVPRADFREETIYFVITTRFYDGDKANNVHCWDDAKAGNPDSDPAWRGDFEGLIQKLDYIKALGFTAIWVTPPVKNSSGYDYHGYHAINFSEIDPRYKSSQDSSAEVSYQRFITAAHAKGIKVIQDIVLNHSGNFGEENLYPIFKRNGFSTSPGNDLTKAQPSRLPDNYDSLTPGNQFQARLTLMKEDANDPNFIYHHEKSLSWESYTVQTGQIDGDCVDLNTENPTTYDYLIKAYSKYIAMGVDSFRIDTVKHISRLTFNKVFNPAFRNAGGQNFFMFGEVCSRYRQVWNNGMPCISPNFFTWKESKDYAWGSTSDNVNSVAQNWNDNINTSGQPSSGNAYLNGNNYHTPDYSKKSDLNVIDFPMHWNFNNASDAFGVAVGNDSTYNDATWNVTYVDSHDYAPDCAPENQRFAGSQSTWAENLSLMFTFRGIPCILYGSEIEFQKGMRIDVGPNAPLSTTGRAYFGDNIEGTVTATDFSKFTASGKVAETLNHPLAKHLIRLNLIRRSIPALQKGQYSTENCNGSFAFKRRFVANGVDSFVLVCISGGASFSGLPAGTYVDAVTGDSQTIVEGGTITANCSGKGNARIYVRNGSGKIGDNGTYLY